MYAMITRPLSNVLFVFTVFMSLAFSVQGQGLRRPYAGYREHRHEGLRYGLFMPAGYDASKPYPLVVYLHGANDTLSRELTLYRAPVQREHPCFILTPKSLNPNVGWGDAWHDAHSPDMVKVLAVVDSLVRVYPIDKNRLYLYGISMGGFGTFSVLSKEPGKFAAGYAVCGGASVEAAPRLLQTPLWIFHGTDDDIVLVRYSRDVYHAMIKLGGNYVRYTEYPGVKHNSWENVAREKSLLKWLFLQEKGRTHGIPDAVQKLTGTSTAAGVQLDWRANTAAVPVDKDVWFYRVFRDGAQIDEVAGDATRYLDTKATAGQKHTYHVIAVNYFFQPSAASLPVTVGRSN
ncbi:carboxylesterase family protein [Dawidia soli]|uniref:Prolyl oligopeptidase family serine peptidase n=1 Tax=Dawidia soli TaxID=2782352 RepID=A0AAP2GBS1_9BACT|nr:prolyl oligopeptidase family serine peptidase [Dawidia soli]MBT1685474.1 prolyl oligopeptidase family serine peptidase [Dawidia soli]